MVVVGIILLIIFTAIGINILAQNRKNSNNQNKDNLNEESSNYYIVGDAIYEKLGDLNSDAIAINIEKMNNVYTKYLKNNNVAFTIIPDKTYYLENKIDVDFKNLENEVKNNLESSIKYFSISEKLSLNDYYRTDMHWKQENLAKAVFGDGGKKQLNNLKSKIVEYNKLSLEEFYGTYSKKIENTVTPDELLYLTNTEIENSIVYNVESEQNQPVYNLEKAKETGNKYDVFLSGASAIEKITNSKSNTGKKLIMFRDSFGSSLAPLLIPYYDEILLIDLRYVNYTILENYIDFTEYEKQDVLFIYSSRVINSAGILR